MRWCYEIEHDGVYFVSAWIDGRPGLGHATHRRRNKAMRVARENYLAKYPVLAREVIEHERRRRYA